MEDSCNCTRTIGAMKYIIVVHRLGVWLESCFLRAEFFIKFTNFPINSIKELTGWLDLIGLNSAEPYSQAVLIVIQVLMFPKYVFAAL